MPTLAEYQKIIDKDTSTETQKLEASQALANYYFTCNEEWSSLSKKAGEAYAELDALATDPNGVDNAKTKLVGALLGQIKTRQQILQFKADAFRDSSLAIKPPSPAMVKKVKDLSAEVAAEQVKADHTTKIKNILLTLAKQIDSVET